jgi:prepilin-type N-terminal cleavage/methylation domain-containing protein
VLEKMAVKRGAFSLVELMLVVVIMGILGALVILNMSTSQKIDSQTEAKRFVRSLYSVRSAWLAYIADRHEFPGVPEYDLTKAAQVAAVQRSLEIYANRNDLDDDVRRYGKINIVTVPVTPYYSHIFLGFDGTGNFGGDSQKKEEVLKILSGDFGMSYRLASGDFGSDLGSPEYFEVDGKQMNETMIRVW